MERIRRAIVRTTLAAALAFGAGGAGAGTAATVVEGLQVNRLVGDAANVGARPVFSWRMATDRPGARQTACRVVVDGVWDSGVREGADSLAFRYGGPGLKPMRRYTWRVSVRDELNNWSAPATGTFSTGTLGGEAWRQTAWIHPVDTNVPGLRVAGFRKVVSADRPVREAWLAVAAAGVFVARVNGEPVTENVLEPGLTHPFRRRQVCTYDVTRLFDCGQGATNVLAVSVSGAWSRDMLSDRSRPGRKAVPQLPAELRAVLVLRHADGTETRVATDSSWQAAFDVDPVVTAGIYEGERVDARRPTDWMRGSACDWPTAVAPDALTGVAADDFRGPPVVLRRDLTLECVSAVVVRGATGANAESFGKAIEVRRYAKGQPMALGPGEMLVVDFGQNASAVPELRLEASAGTHLTIRHAEMLNEGGGRKDRGNDGPEGTPYLSNLRNAYAGIDYICRGGGAEDYRPQFTFFGYRYLSVTADAPVTIRRLVSVPVSSVSAAAEAGTLETGVRDVNRLFANCRWGMLSNYLSVPTDCPQRNERVGWTADTQVFAPAASYLADSHAFLSKWMLDMRDSQREDGCYSQVAPEANSVRGGITGWTDAGVFVPWTLWRKYGDTDVVEENWDSMCRYMGFLDREGGHNHHPFGDWLSYESGDVPWLDFKERDRWNLPAKAFLDDAYWFACARKMSDMASATGRDPAPWRKLAERVRRRFAERNLTAEGTIRPDRLGQCTALVALGFGILESDEARAKTRAALLANIRAHGDRLQTGFLGTSVLMDTLSFDADAHATAVTLLLQRENPSWLYSVDQGATTIWERWNSYTKADGFGPIIMNSFNHYAYGAVAEWMFAALGGIREAEPGYRRIRLEPMPDARLGFVSARFRSPMGEIASEWRRAGDTWRWACTVPPNTEADVRLPDGRAYTLGPGRHETAFRVEEKKLLVFNEDNSAYYLNKYGGAIDEQGYRAYVREIASGGRFTHFFMCPNAMCCNIPSKVMTTTWDAVARPGVHVESWQRGVAEMHRRSTGAKDDIYAVWADECRKQGLSPWFSIRMNDCHAVEMVTNAQHSAFWLSHPELRRVPHSTFWISAALDYAHPEVRAYILGFIREALEQYDVDGIELDWLRFIEHLTPGHETELTGCLDEVVRETRVLADAAAKRLGHPVRVGARIASRPETARARGMDYVRWARSRWIDWLVVGNCWMSTDFDLPYARWAEEVHAANPDVTVLPSTDNGALKDGKRHPLSLAEYSAFADRMYRQGAPGVYLFDFFDNPKTSGVWKAVIAEGLEPGRVAERARGVVVTDKHD